MKASLLLVASILLGCVLLASSTVYFKEDFSEPGWENRWVESKFKEKDGTAGDFVLTAGKWYDDENHKGMQTTPDARFFQISAKMTEFSNKGKDLVLQYSVKHEQKIDCGGGYIKTLPAGLDQNQFHGESPYNIMFGPDICGSSTKKVHVILNYKGTNHLTKRSITAETDQLSHLYTLIIHPDQTYEVLIDNKEKAKGNLLEDWDFLPPKEIPDPAVSKPSDWVDEKEISDPEAKKPEGWDDIPEFIADPDAKKPGDWDDELDGEWEAPMINNPEFKGEWKAAQIPNPAYKGEWVHPKIPNPEYNDDKEIYAYDSHAFIGIEIWQVKAGTIFDDFLVTDDVAAAKEEAEKFLKKAEGEKKMFDKLEEEKRKKEEEERKKREEERKKDEANAAEDLDDDDEDDDEDDENDDDENDENDDDDDEEKAATHKEKEDL